MICPLFSQNSPLKIPAEGEKNNQDATKSPPLKIKKKILTVLLQKSQQNLRLKFTKLLFLNVSYKFVFCRFRAQIYSIDTLKSSPLVPQNSPLKMLARGKILFSKNQKEAPPPSKKKYFDPWLSMGHFLWRVQSKMVQYQ